MNIPTLTLEKAANEAIERALKRGDFLEGGWSIERQANDDVKLTNVPDVGDVFNELTILADHRGLRYTESRIYGDFLFHAAA